MKVEVRGSQTMREHKTNGLYTDTNSSGVSSNDTHRSSVRYEPVTTDHSCTPPSPGRHGSRHRLLGNNKHRSPRMTDEDVTDDDRRDSRDDDVGEEDDIASIDDVIRAEELRPLNSHRRMSSPVVIEHHTRDYGRREASSVLSRTNSGTVYVAKGGPTTLPIEPRHAGLPRMGTGLPPSGANVTSQSTAPIGAYKSQVQNSIVSARLPTSQTEQFEPVVRTTIKPTHVADQSGWNYVGGQEVRNQYPFTSGVPGSMAPRRHSLTAPSGDDTAVRFMSKRPSLANAYNASRHIGNSQFETSGFKNLKKKFSGCSWKCAAISFMILSVLLLAFIAYLVVQSVSVNPPIESDVNCFATSGPTTGNGIVINNGNSEGSIEAPYEIQLGRRSKFMVPPGLFWRSSIYMPSDNNLKFNLTVDRQATLGVYGRKGIKPTHTKYDFFERIDGSSLPITAEDVSSGSRSRRKRDVRDSATMSFVRYMESGSWYLGIYNDGDAEQEAEVATNLAGDLSVCPNDCNRHGDCVNGICKCFPGYQGRDCAEASCPIVCSGRGLYAHGGCVCFSGWKGKDCAIPTDQCEVPDCSGRGTCQDGECECDPGWMGIGCEAVTCLSPTCSNHGTCVQGFCHCDRGWKGKLCDQEDSGCFDKCSGHGTFSDGQCICDAAWSGRDCSQASCLPSCHPEHGTCVAGSCNCDEGWTGAACDERMCHARCYEHGTCSNGQCVCNIGWNGEMCSFHGCLDDCGSHGHCAKDSDGSWFCSCEHGWKGENCNVEVEMRCDNGRDDDRDTLIDCHDPDCCDHPSCKSSPQCLGASDPVQVLSRSRTKRYPAPSFHDRIKFLIRPSSNIQTARAPAMFDESETSVLRGKVETLDGSPLVGVRVQIKEKTEFGYTKTRRDGWYDIMVNGGGSLTLKFERSLLLTTETTVFVPLGDFVIVPTVMMRTASQPDQLLSDVTMRPGNCDTSVFPRPKATILPTDVEAFTADNCDDRGSVIPETQAVRETIGLPFSGVDLVYLSSRTSGYKSKIDIQLTPLDVASNLHRIYLRIIVQGFVFEKMFEPVPELKFSFEWDRRDAYKQPVYGTVTAKVEVGFQYEMCPSIVWEFHMTSVKGHDPSINLGGWSFDIHHTYHRGVVHLGNGGTMRLDRQPPMMSTVMGTGAQRHSSCDQCTGPASRAKLLAPVSLACDASGNIFVGDYNYIRKISTKGYVSSLLFLRNPPHKYYMTASPTPDGTLYYSDPNGKRVYKIRNMNPRPRGSRRQLSGTDVSSNMEVVAGTGEACLPLVQGKCGDGGPALSAKLSGPRGLSIDKYGRVYFIDGTAIRVIETSGVINTFAGSHNMASSRPIPCEGTISLDQLQFDFPTDVTINLFDDSIYVLDSNIVIRIDIRNKQASLVAGVPIHCARRVDKSFDERDARRVPLVSPGSIVSSPLDGSIYIAEADNQFVNRVRRVDPYGLRISTVAGAETSCDCQMSDCECFQGDGDFGRSARLNTPAALAASPNGSIYIADQLNMRIRKLSSSLPELNSKNRYRVANPDSNHVYVFTRDGLHRTTQNVITGTTVYNFTYTVNGLISTITDVHGNRLLIVRDGNDVPIKLILPNGKILKLEFTSENGLRTIKEGFSTVFASLSYQGGDTNLLQSITQGRSQSSFYVYDVHGRLISAVSPSGGATILHVNANSTTHTVTMTQAATSIGDSEENQRGVGSRGVIITTQPGYLCDIVTTEEGEMRAVYKRWTDNSISVRFLDGSELSLETKPHTVLGPTAPFLAKRTIAIHSYDVQKDPLENNIEWRTRKQSESGSPKDERYLLGRRMRVNGRNILSLDYSQNFKMEKIYDDHTKFVLKIQYNSHGMPTLWMPSDGITPVNVTYDKYGHPVTWERGSNHETLTYDEEGHVTSRRTADGATWSFLNQENVVQLTVPGTESHYTYTYDEFGNVRRVALPSGGVFLVTRFVGTGFIRTQVLAGNSKMAVDYDDKNNILMQQYYGEDRKVVYRYDSHGHLNEILHDKQLTKMLRDPKSGELYQMKTDDVTTRFVRNGPLIQTLIVTSESSRKKEISAKFYYTHDVNLRLESMKTTINDTNLPLEEIRYDDVSGKVTTFGMYSVLYYRTNLYVISTAEVTFTKDFSRSPVQFKLDIYRNPIFILSVTFDSMGRVDKQNIRVGMQSNVTQLNYVYRPDGLLSEVTRRNGADLLKWRYNYDQDGKISTIQTGAALKRIRYDRFGRVTMYGADSYSFDKDGFLSSRGHEIFEYDSLGHLVAAYAKDGSYRVKYGYDGFGRLSSRFDGKSRQTLRFYYADISKPTRLTHFFNSTSGLISTLRYDMEGVLFAVDMSNGHAWSIMCDHSGSPLVVIDSSGRVVKQMSYSPNGEVVHSTNKLLQIVVGYRGGIYDPDTRLVHFADRSVIQQSNKFNEHQKNQEETGLFNGVDYDPIIGKTTTPDYSVLLGKRARIPMPLRVYQIWDPVNPVPPYDQMTHVNNWLNALGFKLRNVAPDPKIDERQKDKSSVECQLSHHLQTYINLQTVSTSELVPQARTKSRRIANGALFAQGLVLSVDRGIVTTHVAGTATNDVKRLGTVLNGGEVLIGKDADTPSAPMTFTDDGIPIVYLTKPLDILKADRVTLTMNGARRVLDGGYSDVDMTSRQTTIEVTINNDVLTITSPNGIVVISYVTVDNRNGKTKSSEEKRIIESAREGAEQKAWLLEKENLKNGGQRSQWNSREIQQLKRSGKVNGYKAQFFWDVEKYPEFADSGRNVKFVET